MKEVTIYEDSHYGDYVYFDKDGDFVIESCGRDGGETYTALNVDYQKKIYEVLKDKFDS